MPAVLALIAIVIALYILSPPPIATGVLPSGGDRWAGCAQPRHPTQSDLDDCRAWQEEKRARRGAP